ncbi:sugar transferase [Candidatus Moduliflexus flocculans]|uniref:Sugar transferase n=1 Tax=Candidatus Moduliflexus flocculans TaxID=1499966 RepID=A0A0S6VYC4_9BACT|nr:sugar transferase [Candidatus Moduliflexus flocculans]
MKTRLFCYLFALLAAYGLKAHYSRATSDGLDWILRPTTVLVERVSGLDFEYERGEGYLSRERRIVIAPACAGVNFMIAAFGMTLFSYLHLMPTAATTLLWTAGSLLGAYLLTIAVNALRIVVALRLYASGVVFFYANPAQLHRLEGIAVYLTALCLAFWLAERVACNIVNSPLGRGWGWVPDKKDAYNILPTPCPSQEGNALRKFLLLPLLWYLAITLLVPLLNPNFHGDRARFAEHALTIAAACAVIALLAALARKRLFPRFSLDFICRLWHERQ